jgi:IS4 transposase
MEINMKKTVAMLSAALLMGTTVFGESTTTTVKEKLSEAGDKIKDVKDKAVEKFEDAVKKCKKLFEEKFNEKDVKDALDSAESSAKDIEKSVNDDHEYRKKILKKAEELRDTVSKLPDHYKEDMKDKDMQKKTDDIIKMLDGNIEKLKKISN